jgi:hypothetical protein
MIFDEPGKRQDLNTDHTDMANHRLTEPHLKFGFLKGSGRNNTALTRLTIAVLAPIPSASATTAIAVNAGFSPHSQGVADILPDIGKYVGLVSCP